MEPFVVLLPLFGAMLAMPVGRALGARAAEVTTTALVGVACVIAWLLFNDVAIEGHARTISLFTWIESGDFSADWAIRLDTLTAVMLVVVNTVSFLVHAYSIGYMHEDDGRPRFFAYLSLFTFAMLCLVTADNFLQLFFGWEGVGLASYLLIGFWYKKKSANDAAIKAFVVNRVGDFGFALGIFCVYYVFGSIRFDDVFAAISQNAVVRPFGWSVGAPILDLKISFLDIEFEALTIMALLLFVGAMGKSAQFLLHTWLPDAMEGPTPVSALIHAATMVTAGVFLVCRCSIMFENAPDAAAVVTIVGAVTAFFAASVGLFQDDIKKVIAYSTCSQLGYMFFAAGVGAYGAAMFHLFTHAFFKALLFLGAGCVIHGLHHEQDIKKMGGARTLLPLTHVLMLIGTVAITGVGLPGVLVGGAPIGTAGFVSKDAILESAFAAGEAGRAFGHFAFWLGIAAAVMTAFYSWRLIFLTFWGPTRLPQETRKHPHDVPNVMHWTLAPLAAGGLFAGMAFFGDFVGKHAAEFWNGSIYVAGAESHVEAPSAHGESESHGDATQDHGEEPRAHESPAAASAAEDHDGGHHVPTWVLWAPFIAMAAGTFAAIGQYLTGDPLRPGVLRPGGMIYSFLRNKWHFDDIYDFLFVKPALAFGRFLWKEGDGRTIDGVGPDGVAATVAASARRLVRVQSGYMYHYAFVMLIGLAALVSFIFFRLGGGR